MGREPASSLETTVAGGQPQARQGDRRPRPGQDLTAPPPNQAPPPAQALEALLSLSPPSP